MAGHRSGSDAAPTTYVLVRHAEKLADAVDPALSPDGHDRARRLANALRDRPVSAVYATGYRRTQQTAQPVAAVHGLDVHTYDARATAAHTAALLRQAGHAGTVLVVGHSNTVPAIAAALCGCTVEPMEESEYGRRMEITVHVDGRADLRTSIAP